MNVLILCGGWEKHAPLDFAEWTETLLTAEGAQVTIARSLDTLLDEKIMRRTDLVVPLWSSMGSSHDPALGNLTREQENALTAAVERGTGIGGWHGHMGDAFRDRPNYKFMVGSQFVGHPPGWPDNPIPEKDFITYAVNICSEHPVVSGLDDFTVHSEQYYLHVDPAIEVLATTTFSGAHLPWLEGVVMPITYLKRWGEGRVFYCSVGHLLSEFEIPQLREMIRRGLLWAGNRA